MKKAFTIATLVTALLMITGTATAQETVAKHQLHEYAAQDWQGITKPDLKVNEIYDFENQELKLRIEGVETTNFGADSDADQATFYIDNDADGTAEYQLQYNNGDDSKSYYESVSVDTIHQEVSSIEGMEVKEIKDSEEYQLTVNLAKLENQFKYKAKIGNFKDTEDRGNADYVYVGEFNYADTYENGDEASVGYYNSESWDKVTKPEFTAAEVNIPEDFMSFEVDTSELEFGTVYPGFNSPVREIGMKNTGSKDLQIAPRLDAPEDSVFNHLYFNYNREGSIGGQIGSGSTEIEREVLCTRPDDKDAYSLEKYPDNPCDTTKDGYSYEFESEEIGLETQLQVPDDYEGDGKQTGKIYYIAMSN